MSESIFKSGADPSKKTSGSIGTRTDTGGIYIEKSQKTSKIGNVDEAYAVTAFKGCHIK
jgi:hypothetical protein